VLLNSTGSNTILYANGTDAILNGGTVTLGGDAAHNFLQGTSFTNNSTIQGGGYLQAAITNNSQIIANNKTLRVDSNVDNTNGTMSASGSGNELMIYSSQVTGGQLNPGAGQLTLSSGTLINTTIGAGQVVVENNSILKGTTELAAETTMTINNGRVLYLQAGSANTLNNKGTVLLNSAGGNTILYANGTDAVLNGPGVITLGGDAVHNFLQGTSFTNNGTIQGGGYLQAPITNNGQIIANNKTLRLDNGINNNGALRAKDGGTLNVNSTLTNFSGNTLTGGAYEVDGTGGNSTLKFAFTSTGQIVNNAADITLKGPNANVHLINNNGNELLSTFASNTGSFAIFGGYNFTTAGNLTNAGTVMIGDGSVFKLGAGGTNTYTQTAGLIKGSGVIIGNVDIQGGAVNPGLSPGTLTVNGNFILGNGTFKEEIAGAGLGQFDVLNVVGGNLTLGAGALLDIDLLGGFNPTNHSFTIMKQSGLGDIIGVFANAPSSGFDMDGYHWTIAYNPDSIILYGPTAPIPGTWLLLGSALLGLAGWRSRRR
jgi:fibronectin-binding autotransporter adhesin